MAENPIDLATYQNDHDLLIALNTEMRLLREDIKDMKNGNSITLQDHEGRIRGVENKLTNAIAQRDESDKNLRLGGAILIGVVGILEFVISHFWK